MILSGEDILGDAALDKSRQALLKKLSTIELQPEEILRLTNDFIEAEYKIRSFNEKKQQLENKLNIRTARDLRHSARIWRPVKSRPDRRRAAPSAIRSRI